MPAFSQSTNKTVVYLLTAVCIAALAWWAAPAGYTAINALLPSAWSSQVNSQTAGETRRIAELEAQIANLKTANRQLRVTNPNSAVGTTTLPTEHVSAQVLARPPQTAYDVLLINKGTTDAVTAGSAVWWPPGVYLGEVIEARTNNALVRLISSPEVRHAGRIDNSLTVTTRGQGGGSMTATVPAESEVATGTIVISDRYTAPIARVVGREPASALAQQRLFLQPVVSASVIKNVYVEQ